MVKIMKENTNSVDDQSVKYQYIAAVVANITTICFGIAEGWASPSIYLLTSDESPLQCGKITMEEATWIASLLSIGCMFGNIFFGYITNKFGRKIPLILTTVPIIISWILILIAPDVRYLYVSRIINGIFSGGCYVIIPLYLSEISNDRIRGALVSSLVLSENLGIVLAFIFGYYFDFYMMPQFVISIMALFAVLLLFLPDTATFYVKQNKILQAEKSIRFYQNLGEGEKADKLVEIELNRVRSIINHSQEEKSDKNSFKWSDLKTAPAKKAMTIGLVLVILNNFAGVSAMLNYTANIFEEAGSYMDPNISAIVIGVIQLFGTVIATHLVDRAGRKFLFAVSNFGTAFGLTVLGAYMMFKSWDYPVEAFNWIPIISFSFVIFVAALGILSLPLLILSEVLPEKMKNFGVTTYLTLAWLFSFALIKYLPLLTDSLGFDMSMYLFAGVCLLSEVYIILYVPETKGKSHHEIIGLFHIEAH